MSGSHRRRRLYHLDYIIHDEIVMKRGVTEAASLSFELFNDCDSSEKLAAVFYGSRPNGGTLAHRASFWTRAPLVAF